MQLFFLVEVVMIWWGVGLSDLGSTSGEEGPSSTSSIGWPIIFWFYKMQQSWSFITSHIPFKIFLFNTGGSPFASSGFPHSVFSWNILRDDTGLFPHRWICSCWLVIEQHVPEAIQTGGAPFYFSFFCFMEVLDPGRQLYFWSLILKGLVAASGEREMSWRLLPTEQNQLLCELPS